MLQRAFLELVMGSDPAASVEATRVEVARPATELRSVSTAPPHEGGALGEASRRTRVEGSSPSMTRVEGSAPSTPPQVAGRERMFTFVDRATGLILADGAGGTVLIRNIVEEGSAAGSQKVPRSGVVLAVNGISVAKFSAEKVKGMLERVAMPMTVRVRDP